MPACGRCTGCGPEFSGKLEDAPAAARKRSLQAQSASGAWHRHHPAPASITKCGPEPITLASDMPFTTGAADQPVRPPVLAQEDGVSYRTADHALQTLKDEGPIIAVRGKGFYTTHPNN